MEPIILIAFGVLFTASDDFRSKWRASRYVGDLFVLSIWMTTDIDARPIANLPIDLVVSLGSNQSSMAIACLRSAVSAGVALV